MLQNMIIKYDHILNFLRLIRDPCFPKIHYKNVFQLYISAKNGFQMRNIETNQVCNVHGIKNSVHDIQYECVWLYVYLYV